jgi:thiol-disulfide isomerase/thioredoxin
MKKIIFPVILLAISLSTIGQKPGKSAATPTETSVVKDSSGTEFPYVIWSKLFYTGHFNFSPENPALKNSAFIITRLSDSAYEQRMAAMPRPVESNFFKTGSSFSHFKAKDINGTKINTKELAGKTIVLNFWFIKCPPCQLEMPELNYLSETYKADSSVVFIAVALDQEEDIREFLRYHPFGYKIIDDGRFISSQYRLTSYPTNVIIDPGGKVYFHSTGLAMNTVYWLKKSIEELKKSAE